MPSMSFKGKAAQAVFDALTKPPKPLPKQGVMSGNLLKAARTLEPGKGMKMEADTGESYVLIRTEDFEHVCEQSGMRARYAAEPARESK